METYFEVKVKFPKIMENGSVKKVTEPYLISAMSHTEAESRAITELEPYLSGEFVIHRITPANYTDIFPFADGDRWFKCKVSYISIDEKKGIEKKKASFVLVQAINVKHAWDNLSMAMKDSVVDYEVKGINETPIMDYFH